MIMGVVNITPDSFSDGGDFLNPEAAITQIQALFRQGCDLVDIGAESTRPGATCVSPEEEFNRLKFILSWISANNLGARVSLDSRHDETILRATRDFGIKWINNIAGLAEPATLRDLAKTKDIKYIAMHMRGTPETMQQNPLKGSEAVIDVADTFCKFQDSLLSAGFIRSQIYLDPGIGFGKNDSANIKLLAETAKLAKDYQVAIGVSRKAFFGRILEISEPKDRDGPAKMLELGLMFLGAKIIRTHQVAPLVTLRDLWLT